jgi:hypothetical protein
VALVLKGEYLESRNLFVEEKKIAIVLLVTVKVSTFAVDHHPANGLLPPHVQK